MNELYLRHLLMLLDVRAEIAAVRRAMQLLEQFEAVWRGRVDRMSALLDEDKGVTP